MTLLCHTCESSFDLYLHQYKPLNGYLGNEPVTSQNHSKDTNHLDCSWSLSCMQGLPVVQFIVMTWNAYQVAKTSCMPPVIMSVTHPT